MIMRLRLIASALAVASTALTALGSGAAETPAGRPAVERIGEQLYRIGRIEIDRAGGRFSVPGEVIALAVAEDPLEFLAVAKSSFKDYEALLRVDTDAVSFNLACILIGLEGTASQQPVMHFDPKPIEGPRVSITVSWGTGESKQVREAGNLLRTDGREPIAEEWVYTGSAFTDAGEYAAQSSGVLIGFVHDPFSIIHHRAGLGLGNYGAVRSNLEIVPAPGTAIVLTVERQAPAQ